MDKKHPDLVRPVQQTRSRERLESIVEAGLALLDSRSFDEITMEMIAAEAGCSVGTIYKRFTNREALLVVLANVVHQDVVRELQSGGLPEIQGDPALLPILQLSFHFMTKQLRAREGLVRAMLTRQLTHPGSSQPLREAGREILQVTLERSSSLRPGHMCEAEFQWRMQVGFQIAISTLINTIINRAGPLQLDDASTPDHLAHVAYSYLIAP